MKKFTSFNAGGMSPWLFFGLCLLFLAGTVSRTSAQTVAVTFRVNMTNQFIAGLFDPTVDSVDIMGTMNGWTGSPAMSKVGFSLIYEISYNLDARSVAEFKFRSRGESTIIETPDCGPNRSFRVPEMADTTTCFFSDFQPGTVPVTFKCNLSFQIRTKQFDPAADYLNFSGSNYTFSGYHPLYNKSTDSTYELCMNVDTSYVSTQTPILYKYQINGNPANEELPGQDFRIARVQDTAGGHQNLFYVYYNNEAPDIPNPPVAYDVNLQGEPKVGHTFTGTYMYADVNNDPEGNSNYRWFRADSPTQATPDTIPGETTVNYLISSADSGKYIAFEVTPVANSDEYNVGIPVKTWSAGKITNNVGIHDLTSGKISLYPNPASDFITIKDMKGITRIELFSLVGKMILSVENGQSASATINLKGVEPGIYFIKLYSSEKGFLTTKFMKN